MDPILRRYIVEKMREPGTWMTAVVVGILINLYGHALVPFLRGHDDVLGEFVAEFQTDPGLVSFSVALGFIFPFLVGTYASVATRYRNRHHESRALFPDAKPDPVFRADADGTIVELGEGTETLFRRYHVTRAQDILGEDVWSDLTSQRGTSPEASARVYFAPEDRWYLVGHSPAPDGNLNVYLTRVPAGLVPNPQ